MGCPRRGVGEADPRRGGHCGGVVGGWAGPSRRTRERLRPRACCSPEVLARAGPDRPGDHPELLHHRPHRPRQVDAGRPDAPADRRGRRAGCARAVPRPDGHRARARHHHQVPGRADAVGRRPGQRAGHRRRHLRAEHDRHPGPRRLHLRGLPLPGGLRGRDPAGRRSPGHRGADPGEPLPRHGCRPPHHPGAQQDRPAQRQPREVRRGAGRPGGLRARGRAAGQRQDRVRRRGPARRDRQADPAAGRCGRQAGPRADLRLRLRHLPRRGHLRPRGRRQAQPPRPDQDDVDRRDPRDARGRRDQPRAGQGRGDRGRRGRLPHHRREGRPPVPCR